MGLQEEGQRVLASEGDYVEPPPRARRGRPKGKKKKVAEPEFQYQPNESSIAGCVIISKVVFRVICRLAQWEDITDEEATEIGKALDPVLQKRLPALAGWGEELALGMVLIGVLAPRLMDGKVPLENPPTDETVEDIKREVAAPFTVVNPETPTPKPAPDKDW